MNIRLIQVLAGILAASVLASDAKAAELEQVFIRTEAQFGRGFMVRHVDRCFLIFPAHVMTNTCFANILAAETGPVGQLGGLWKLAEAKNSALFDLAFGEVEGEFVHSRCNMRLEELPRDLGALLRQQEMVTIEGVNEVLRGDQLYDGVTTRVNAWVDEVQFDRLWLKLGDPSSVMQGMSGSVVSINGNAIGMLTGVNQNEGTALRIDAIGHALRNAFGIAHEVGAPKLAFTPTCITSESELPEDEGVPDIASVSAGGEVQTWTWPIGDPENGGPERLIKPGFAPVQFAKGSAKDRLDIVIALSPRGSSDVRRIKIEHDFPNGLENRPFQIEVLASRSQDGRDWLPLKLLSVMPSEHQSIVEFPPIAAKRIQLRLHLQSSVEQHSIRRIYAY